MVRWVDNVFPPVGHKAIYEFVNQGGWKFGWQSNAGRNDTFKFWHKHFAGARSPDHPNLKKREDPYDCTEELKRTPILFEVWKRLSSTLLQGHVPVRCYANAHAFGGEGTLHTDSVAENSFTVVYYPHPRWSPNWGGETVFFNKEENEIISCCYPRPNRLCAFKGVIPHVARGVSRTCPVLRVTLMFKTELRNARQIP